MRLIDADELLKRAGNCYDVNDHLLYAVGTGDIIRAKTIDAVPVVRCKDCVFFDGKEIRNLCRHSDAMVTPEPEDYCSRGERRTG